jgi:hypothetical protein
LAGQDSPATGAKSQVAVHTTRLRFVSVECDRHEDAKERQ